MGLTNETAVAISLLRETALNENYTLEADYIGVIPENPVPFLPNMEKTSDVGRAGKEFAGLICNGYWNNHRLTLALRANFNDAGRLMLRHVSGPITKTVLGRTGGTAQVETATVAGTITADGTVKVTITAAGLPGSPLDVFVDVVDTDTAAIVAGKIRDALAAHTIVGNEETGFFTVSGTTTAVVLTKNVPEANDGTLNIATDNGTATGLTPAASSANTTAGVAGTAAAWKHAAPMLNKSAGYQLDSWDILTKNEAADFGIAGVVSNQLTIAQEGTALPVITADVISTGKGFTPIGFDPPVSDSDVPCLDGASTRILYTDEAGDTFDMYAVADVRSWSVVLANNLVTDPVRTRKGGDPKWGPTDGEARYVTQLKRGNRTVQGQITIAIEDSLEWWEAMCRNDEFTDLTFEINGPITGGVAQKLAVVIPLSSIQTTEGVDANGDAAHVLTFVAQEDPVTGGGATVYVVNDIENDYE